MKKWHYFTLICSICVLFLFVWFFSQIKRVRVGDFVWIYIKLIPFNSSKLEYISYKNETLYCGISKVDLEISTSYNRYLLLHIGNNDWNFTDYKLNNLNNQFDIIKYDTTAASFTSDGNYYNLIKNKKKEDYAFINFRTLNSKGTNYFILKDAINRFKIKMVSDSIIR